LEGYVEPDELRTEGPFGDHTGYYSLVGEYPVFHVTAITHRARPVYSATIVGRPPMEDCYLAKATERIFLPLLNAVLPEIRDFWMPWEGVFHNIAVISISKEYPGHARKVMSAIWGQGQMSFCKAVVLVDGDVDLKNARRLFDIILDEVDLKTDLFVSEGILDVLDHSSPEPLFGGKLGLDATRRIPGEKEREHSGPQPPAPSSEIIERSIAEVSEFLVGSYAPRLDVHNKLLLLNLRKQGNVSGRVIAEGILKQPGLTAFNIFVLYDDHIDLKDSSLVLWKLFNNVDPRRDIEISRHRIVIDATKKGREDDHIRPWPDDITMDPEVVKRVERRASELGIEEYLP
jgi:4-hydroxy-3-polyprenylbenzoate decarboxylase